MPLKCYKEGLVFLVAKTLKDIINHSLTGLLEALCWGVWGGCVCGGGRGLSNADHHDRPTAKKIKITLAKTPLNSPQKTKFGSKNK